MTRPLRLDHAGAVWHVTSRGNERRDVFLGDRDRRRFLETLGRTVERFLWRVHAYVLMGNHYHLLLETPEPNLSRGVHMLNGLYAQAFNRTHGRCGHLFQGRFKAILVERQSHLLELARYVVLNPVRAGLVQRAEQWTWSNYRATAGLAPKPAWLEVAWTRGQFGSTRSCIESYRSFVAAGKTSPYAPWEELVGQIYLGGELFLRSLSRIAPVERRTQEIPRVQGGPFRPTIEQLLAAISAECGLSPRALRLPRRTDARLALAYLARQDAALKLGEFAPVLGVREATASHLAAAGKRLFRADPEFKRRVNRIRESTSKFDDSQT